MHNSDRLPKIEVAERNHVASNLQSSTLEQILQKTNELAVLPHVVFRVIELTSSEDTVSKELERAIVVDPGFSSKLLVMANSAAFGLPKRVGSIREAIMFLGFRSIRSVALTVGMFDAFVGKTDRASLRRREWWRHSVDSAICARFLAKMADEVPVEDAYTAGLLHLIGKMLLEKYGTRDYGLVQRLLELGAPSEQMAEKQVFGCDHCQVASEAAARWGLPPALQSGLRYLEPAEPTDPFGSLRACTLVATKMAEVAKTGEKGDATNCPRWAMERLHLTDYSMADLGIQGRRLIAEANLRI